MHIEGLDDIDNSILNLIKKDARLSYSKIGEKIGLSRVAVRNRMESMESKGIIRGYETIINEEEIADGRRFFMDIITEPDMFEQVTDAIAKYDIVRKVYAVTGESRLRVEGYASSKKKYEMFMGSIKRQTKGMKSCIVQEVLYTVKDLDGGVEYEPLDKKNKSES